MYSIVTEGRVQMKGGLTKEEVHELLNYKELEVIQFQSEIEPNTFQLLNDVLFSKREDVVLRVYGFISSQCDLSFLKSLSNLSRFYAECYQMVENLEAITFLKNLRVFNLSIYGLDSFEILSRVPDSLEQLILGETKSKKPDLSILERFRKLRKLLLVGHKKNIGVLEKLESLEQLTLTSITVKHLEFLIPLKKLWYLNINFGGIHNFAALEGVSNIQYLELVQIRLLSDLSFISNLPGLQYLSLKNLPNVGVLPDFSNMSELKKVELENLKGLKNISSLEHAPMLVEFTHWSAMNMQAEDYVPLLKNPSMKRISVGFGSEKKNTQLEKLAEEYGKTDPVMWHNIHFFRKM